QTWNRIGGLLSRKSEELFCHGFTRKRRIYTDRAEKAERAKSFFATDLRGSPRIGPRRPVAQGSSAAACERPLQIEGPCRAWCFRWPQPDPCKSAQSAQIRGKKTLPNSVEANRGFVKEPQR